MENNQGKPLDIVSGIKSFKETQQKTEIEENS